MKVKNEPLLVHAHFNNIENLLTKYIAEAESEIFIAVAWFTNQNIFKHLLRAVNRHVMVKLLTLCDRINVTGGLDFQMIVDAGGELYLSSSSNDILHNKYCIIDGKYVITGSYNFTYYAENVNSENIVVISSQEVASQYMENFVNILKVNDHVTDYRGYKSTHECQRDVFAADYFLEIEGGFKLIDESVQADVNTKNELIYYNERKDCRVQVIIYHDGELIVRFETDLDCSSDIHPLNTENAWRLEYPSDGKVYMAHRITHVKINDSEIIEETDPCAYYDFASKPNSNSNSRSYYWFEAPKKYKLSCDIHFKVPELISGVYDLYEGDCEKRELGGRWNVPGIHIDRH